MTMTDRALGVIASQAIKVPVRAASVAALVLSGIQTVDGVLLAEGDRVLASGNGVNAGIYVVSSGNWTRAADWDGTFDIVNGTLVVVAEGTALGGEFFRVTTVDPIVIGTTSLTFVQEISSSHTDFDNRANVLETGVAVNSPEEWDRIINGGFDIWLYKDAGFTDPQTSNGYGSDSRWVNGNVGSSKTHARSVFTPGQTDVPGNPKYYSTTAVTSVAGANNFANKLQRIEGVESYAGKTITLSFYAKADAVKNVAIEFSQVFGTGGAPSATVSGIGGQLVALTTNWALKSITIAIPSISGKTLGTAGDDHLAMTIFFDAGSNFNARAANLGQQSGTFDISNVWITPGSAAAPFKKKLKQQVLDECSRYWTWSRQYMVNGTFNNIYPGTTMRKAPTALGTTSALTVAESWPNVVISEVAATGANDLQFDAEL